jgi:hypothetical protein
MPGLMVDLIAMRDDTAELTVANWLIVYSDPIRRATSCEERYGYFRYAQLQLKHGSNLVKH